MKKAINIAIVADTHLLDSLFSTNRFSELITTIINTKPTYTYIWFIGDIFHHSRISSELTVFFKEEMQRLIDNGIIPKYIEGNHERRTAADYLLSSIVTKLSPITPLPREFKIHNTSFHAYGHDVLNDLVNNTSSADILLSHLRWKTSLYDGELPTKQLQKLTSQYGQLLLGDIHTEYSPTHNATYINSPYNIHYGTVTPRGYIHLEVDSKGYDFKRVHLTLPNKIEVLTSLDELQSTLDSVMTDKVNMYKVKVAIMSESELPQLQAHKLVGANYMVVHTFTGAEVIEDVIPTRELTDIGKAFEEAVEREDLDYIKTLIE